MTDGGATDHGKEAGAPSDDAEPRAGVRRGRYRSRLLRRLMEDADGLDGFVVLDEDRSVDVPASPDAAGDSMDAIASEAERLVEARLLQRSIGLDPRRPRSFRPERP